MYVHIHVHTCMCTLVKLQLHVCMYYINIITVFTQIVAVATINFALSSVRLLIEGGSYLRAATINFV